MLMENSLSESEDSSPGCPAETWLFVTEAAERPK